MELTRTPKTKQHQAKILCLNGLRVRIDVNIVPLVEGLYKLGIKTASSCGAGCGGGCNKNHRSLGICKYQPFKRYGNNQVYTYHKTHTPKACAHSVWLIFATPKDAEAFLNIVYNPDDSQKLQDYMLGYGSKNSYAWNWGNMLRDDNDHRVGDHRGYWSGKRIGPPKFSFRMGVVFPHAHLDLITQRVLKHKRSR